VRPREQQEDEMADNGLEAFAISFAKLVQIIEKVNIDKDVDVDVWVQGTLAMADAKGEAFAFGDNTVTETLALTQTKAVEGVGSESHSIAESLSAGTSDAKWDMTLG
jgi:hypothetical protein